MPYIPQSAREDLVERRKSPETPGELNYLLTYTCLKYLQDRGDTRYYTINEVMGALECAKLEFYRRAVEPYENECIEKNGDVYGGVATQAI